MVNREELNQIKEEDLLEYDRRKPYQCALDNSAWKLHYCNGCFCLVTHYWSSTEANHCNQKQ